MRLHPRFRFARLLFFALLMVLPLLAPFAAQAQEPARAQVVDVIHLEGLIDPPSAEYLSDRLAQAEEDNVEVAVIQLDTPGGLDISMREMVQQIVNLEVPVVVWVAPRGARAASAGTFIAYAADLVFMAEDTTIGAATPIDLGGGDLEQKVTEDAVAYITELATSSGRDAEWAESAVRDGAAIGASEAVELGVVNGQASSLGDLLRAMDGQEVVRGSGMETIGPNLTSPLETWSEETGTPSVAVRFQQMNLMQRLLHAITGPETAFLLLIVGFFGIIFELYNPGIGLAGIIGAVCLLFGFYGLSVMPTNWLGVLLIVAAIAAFIIDLQIAGFGIWTVAGIAGLVVGGMILFDGTDPVTVSPWAIAAAVAGSLLFFVSIMTAALRVRLRRPVTGEEGIVGTIGEAKTDIAPEGMVLSKGMLWRARTMEMGIAAGDKVEVKATEGLVLLVEPYHGHAHVTPPDPAGGAQTDPTEPAPA